MQTLHGACSIMCVSVCVHIQHVVVYSWYTEHYLKIATHLTFEPVR